MFVTFLVLLAKIAESSKILLLPSGTHGGDVGSTQLSQNAHIIFFFINFVTV